VIWIARPPPPAKDGFRKVSLFFTDGEGVAGYRKTMEHKGIRCDIAAPSGAPLPAERAFVVQLRAASVPAGELFVGRAEHMASGSAARFTSAAELIAFITRMLAGDDDPQPAQDARGPSAIANKERRS